MTTLGCVHPVRRQDHRGKPGIDYGTNPRTGERAQAKQLEVIAGRSNVERVLLSIGGNNLQFSDLIKWCVEANVKFAGACKNQQRVKDLTNQANQDRVPAVHQRCALQHPARHVHG